MLNDFAVATFLRDQASRGKSIPNRLFHTLRWFENVFGFDLSTESQLAIGQSHPPERTPAAAPKIARMVMVKMVADMEDFITKAPTAPLRCYAGGFCCLAHGVLRWADLLWSWEIHLTTDAIVGVCWRMKKKRRQTPWAAFRNGFTNSDWAGNWVQQLEEVGLPKDDHVLLAVSRDGCNFSPTNRVAGFNDGIAMMRHLLIIAGMEPSVALTFTLHSWRHLLPTAARQLRLSETEHVEIGHWSVGSAMPRMYDSAACVTELTAKNAICSAINSGWTLVDRGCVALPPPISKPAPPPAPSPPMVPLPQSSNQFWERWASKMWQFWIWGGRCQTSIMGNLTYGGMA